MKMGQRFIIIQQQGKKCTSGEVVTTSEAKSGCMKWYAFLDSETSSNVNIILNHNTTTYVEAGTNMKTAIEKLNADTKDWKVDTNTSPGLITADEVAKIVGADRDDTLKWSSQKPIGTDIEKNSNGFFLEGRGNSYSEWNKFVPSTKKYEWLYENICEVAGSYCGYWTSTVQYASTTNGWLIDLPSTDSDCYLASRTLDDVYSIRPVIIIAKEVLD